MGDAARPRIAGTRGELLAVLCTANRTVSELARGLGLANNTVRAHLDRLEEEGLVRYRVVRRGVGKPAHEYELTDEGSLRLSRAYLPVFARFLDASVRRVGELEVEAALKVAGRGLAEDLPRATGSPRERAEATVELLAELGGIGRVREDEGILWIEGACCPLRALVTDQPLACRTIVAMVEEFTGLAVHDECDRRSPPVCRLLLGHPGR